MSGMPSSPSPFDLQPAAQVSAGGFWSTWEDALDIFYSPTEVFQRRRDGRYGLALLIVIALSIVVFVLSAQVNEAIFDIEFQKGMAQQAERLGRAMTDKEIAASRAFMSKFSNLAIYLIPLFASLSAWFTGLVLMLLGNLMGGKFNYAKATTLGVLAGFPEVLNRLAIGAQGLFLDANAITSKYTFAISAARFLPDSTNPLLLKLAAIADPFVLWVAFLVGLGAHVLGDMEKEKAAVLAIIYTVITALLVR